MSRSDRLKYSFAVAACYASAAWACMAVNASWPDETEVRATALLLVVIWIVEYFRACGNEG